MLEGKVVYSNCGRDAGKPFVVVKTDELDFVFLSDGKHRRIENAKRKKRKHIKETDYVDTIIRDKFANGDKVTNSDIRKCLASYLEEQN